MGSALANSKVQNVLNKLYAHSAEVRESSRQEAQSLPETASRDEFYTAMRNAYMCIGPEFGNLLYSTARSMNAKTVVEFGTSFGVSTIYLAAALKDNGGRLITCEFLPEKAAQAKRNLEEAGLADVVEFRVGDAFETLKENIPALDMIFLDGPKDMYMGVLKMTEGKLRVGGVVAGDNTNHRGLENYLEHVRDLKNGYISSSIKTNDSSHEISIKF